MKRINCKFCSSFKYFGKVLILVFYLQSSFVQGQNIEVHKLQSPDSKNNNDLFFLKKELQSKDLVMLGEMTHMYGDIFEMKARIVEYLHKEMGFTTIALESSMYDLWKMSRKSLEFDVKLFNNTVWSSWADTEEFQRLVNYIDQNNLKVIGFDSQVNNSADFIDDFLSFLKKRNYKISLNEDEFAILIESILESASFDDHDINFKDFENQLTSIINYFTSLKPSEENFYWLQFTKSLFACAKDAYYNIDPIYSSYFADKEDNFRDEQMADNILAYVEKYPNEKVICWADNIHIVNDISSVSAPIIKHFVPMGSYIKKKLGSSVYSLATLHANDSLYEKREWHATPVQTSSFENELKSFNTPYLFVSSNQEGMRKDVKSRLFNFVDFIDGRIDEFHDGYIFLKQANLPKNGVSYSVKEKRRSLQKNPSNNDLEYRGKRFRIIDAQTEQPVPYASIILKDEEIYRISNEDGYFELPKRLSQSKVEVNVSSLGFKTFTISLNKLEPVLRLDPSVEELDTVIINSYISPETVLKKVIKALNKNYPINEFNYDRYSRVVINKKDKTLLDVELITKEYDEGYNQLNIPTQRVEQIKWNKNLSVDSYKTSSQFFHFRQNAIQYANILHKRKYKKFELEFIKSNEIEDEGFYVIRFKTERNKWSFTNHAYPTYYSGRIYINKEDYSVRKIIQNWETTLYQNDIEEYKVWFGSAALDKKEIRIKEENVCVYEKKEDQKYYTKNYYFKLYTDKIDQNDMLENTVFESTSFLFNFKTTDPIEEIPYEHRLKKQTRLDRVTFDSEFWESFYENNSIEH